MALGAERSRPAVRVPRAAEAGIYIPTNRRSQWTGEGRNFGSTCHSRLARRTSWCSPRRMSVPLQRSCSRHTAEKSAAARAGTVATAVARAGAGDRGRGDGRAQGQTPARRPSKTTTFGQKTHTVTHATLFSSLLAAYYVYTHKELSQAGHELQRHITKAFESTERAQDLGSALGVQFVQDPAFAMWNQRDAHRLGCWGRRL